MKYEQLWAPWRLAYVTGELEEPARVPAEKLLPGGDPECFICQAVTGGDERNRLVILHGERTITLLNRFPYNNGHLLVAPRKHLGRLDELDDATHLELMQTLTLMTKKLEKIIAPQGFNVGLNLGRAAGAGLPGHLHWHIVPRWNGDTHFMPIMEGVRVIPQSLEALWDLLTEELRK